jgi:hypothetical protein
MVGGSLVAAVLGPATSQRHDVVDGVGALVTAQVADVVRLDRMPSWRPKASR